MKAILAAAAFAVMGAQADAATYRFEFTKTSGEWPWLAELYLSAGNPFVVIDVPSLRNLDIFQFSYGSDGEPGDEIGPPIVASWLGTGDFDPEDGEISIATDEYGALKSISMSRGYGSIYYLDVFMDKIVGEYEGTFEEAPGYWTIYGPPPAPVSLPATAPMLLTGAALIFGLRRRFKA